MKSIFFIVSALAVILSCRSRQTTDPFLIEIELRDSLITYANGSVIDSTYARGIRESALTDSMESLQRAMDDSVWLANVHYAGRVVCRVLSDVPSMYLLDVAYAVRGAQFNECRFVWPDKNLRDIEIPIIAPQGFGVFHVIKIDTTGLTFSTVRHMVLEYPGEIPFDASRKPYSLENNAPILQPAMDRSGTSAGGLEAQKRKQIIAALRRGRMRGVPFSFSARSHGHFIRRKSGRLDLEAMSELLDRLTEEFERIGYRGGRHYVIAVSEDIPSSEFLAVAKTTIESVSKEAQLASWLNTHPWSVPSPPSEQFRYYNGLNSSFSQFSISIASPSFFGSPFAIGSDNAQIHRDTVTMFELTNPAGFLAGAILHNDLNRIDRLISRLPTYPFKDLSGLLREDDWWDSADRREYTPLLLAIEAGTSDVVRHLIRSGADVNLGSDDGTVRPLNLAIQRRDQEIIRLLREAGAR